MQYLNQDWETLGKKSIYQFKGPRFCISFEELKLTKFVALTHGPKYSFTLGWQVQQICVAPQTFLNLETISLN